MLFNEFYYVKVLPTIKKEITLILFNNGGFSQKKIAEYMKLTQGAISQYKSGKRGNKDFKFNMKKEEDFILESFHNNIDFDIVLAEVLANLYRTVKDIYVKEGYDLK